MSIASIAASHIKPPVSPAVLLGVGGQGASGFSVPGSSGVAAGDAGSLATGNSAASSASLSPAVNALMLQIQQGTNAARGDTGAATEGGGIGTPDGVHHHRHQDGSASNAAGDNSSASASSASGDASQSADATSSGSAGASTGSLLLGDMMQAMQTYAAIGGMLLI